MGAAMGEELFTTIQRIEAAPGQRLLVVSDIHGYADRLERLLEKMQYRPAVKAAEAAGKENGDILIIVGDLVDKGPESLRVVRYVMELCRRYRVYVSMGNVDWWRVKLLADDSLQSGQEFAGFLNWSEEYWGGCLYADMLAESGIDIREVTAENAPACRRLLRERFREELEFLWSRPTILTAGDYLFVHGGVPTDDPAELEGTPAVPYLKNDAFWKQGYCFKRYTVVTGHWPTCLYRQDREDMSPLFDGERRIICIDGGNGVKSSGQLNGLMIPDRAAGTKEISWTCCDDFEVITAKEHQEERCMSFHIQYLDRVVELLEERKDMGRFRRVSDGQEFDAPLKWMYRNEKQELCYCDFSDAALPVEPGDLLSVVLEAGGARYVKKDGRLGWYYGK